MNKKIVLSLPVIWTALIGTFASVSALPPPSTPSSSTSLPSQKYSTPGSSPSVGAPPSSSKSSSSSTKPSTSTSSGTTSPSQPLIKKFEKNPIKAPEGGATLYTSPGVIAVKEGGWVGSDNLYNLSDKIGISIEILKPASLVLTVTDEGLKNLVAEALRKVGIQPIMNPEQTSDPLPFFHLLVMLYPHENTLAIFCEGRLFENIKLDRVVMEKTAELQGITWEKQSLVIVPLFDASAQVGKAMINLTNAFTERYTYFEHVKSQRSQD